MRWIDGVRALPKIAILPEKANEQHYEVRALPSGSKNLPYALSRFPLPS